MKTLTALALVFAVVGYAGCTRDVQASEAQRIEQEYGVSGAVPGTVATPDGPIKGTLVPITLANGRQGQLFIPQQQANAPQAVYLRDEQGLHALQVRNHATRDEVVRAPAIVETQAAGKHPTKRSWEKDALIIGGSAGAGTAIGALAGGKKGAAVGAAAGGVGGLIFDLIARHKEK